MSVVLTVLAFAGLIVFHELGHYLVAKLSGMRVDRFSIGFGPTLLSRQVGETEWAVAAFPIGGYVKIAGMDPTEEVGDDPRAYQNRPAWQRFLVVIAGPVANYLLAVFVFAAMFNLGQLEADPSQVIVGQVMEDSPAQAAGLHEGDRILAVNGTPVEGQEHLQSLIRPHPGTPLKLEVERDGERLTLTVTPREETLESGETIGLIGIAMVPGVVQGEGLPLGTAVLRGVEQTAVVNMRIVAALGDVIVRLPDILFGDAEAPVQGPAGIVNETKKAADRGLVYYLFVVGLISVNLGLFNLLPIPALDGGRLVFLLAEVVRRKPVAPRFELAVHAVGFVFLLGLILLVTVGDVKKIFFGG